jgi:mannan endo-1,4-beta-mannosidase
VAGGLTDGVSARWTANLTVPFTETYKLITTTDDGVRLWLDGWPVIDDWADQSVSDNTATAKLIAGQIYSIRMEWYDNTSAAVARLSWESPLQARQIIPQGWLQLPLWATGPSPANTEPAAPQDAVLQWAAGEEATDHDVYFGDDAAAVANADTGTAGIYQGRQKADKTTFDPGLLEWGKKYFWRVDEINSANAASPWKGSVWSFTTADFLIIDDFESYTDEEGVGARIYETWADGYSDGSSGSIVGYVDPPFAEQKTVHGGRQSMPLDYNNVNTPFFSEAKREWSGPQNWTVNGVDSLTLYFRGNSKNGQEKLYVILADSTGKSAMVVHPDAGAAAVTKWTEWKIPFASFTGVNAAKAKSLIIGLGDKNNAKKGGAGLLFIDDIRATRP